MQKLFARKFRPCNLRVALAESPPSNGIPNGLGYALGGHLYRFDDRPTFTEPKVCFNQWLAKPRPGCPYNRFSCAGWLNDAAYALRLTALCD